MELIILGHIVGDFYLQTDKVAEKKKTSWKYMMLHCILYMILMSIIILLLSDNLLVSFGMIALVAISHFLIDYVKIRCDKRLEHYQYMIFLLDQLLHIGTLILITYLFRSHIATDYHNIMPVADHINITKIITITCLILINWKPADIFIVLVFQLIPNTIEEAQSNMTHLEVNKIGSWIGILEREIILMLGIIGQCGTIGFVLTAKSLARFKQLENKAFAEKYLVGTLLSAMIAILGILILKVYRFC